jgi:methionyl-tRNA formyltransferase
MNLVFMGSGAFAVPSLEALLKSSHRVTALVTQPDKPAGRGHGLRMPPTKPVALERAVAVHQPARVRSEESVALLRGLAPDCIVVVAYGQIIPKAIIEVPPKGIVNVHASLLPLYRGAAPINWAIARGETETGVTTMLMNEGLDTGPILLSRSLEILESDTGGTLEAKLAVIGAELLVETLSRWSEGNLEPTPQDDRRATLAPRIRKEHARIEWSSTAREIHLRVRAFDPWPVAFVTMDGEPVRIWKTGVVSPGRSAIDAGEPDAGRILGFQETGIVVACGGKTALLVEEVQAPGRNRMSATAFARGRRLGTGDRFGDIAP